jgi:hypothetical protein
MTALRTLGLSLDGGGVRAGELSMCAENPARTEHPASATHPDGTNCRGISMPHLAARLRFPESSEVHGNAWDFLFRQSGRTALDSLRAAGGSLGRGTYALLGGKAASGRPALTRS